MDQSRIPWPGPRPYEEPEFRLFFGRNDEIGEIRRRLSEEKLTVLAGYSGTGKTSLLRAGVVPALRLRRFRGTSPTPWPVLILRDWGAGDASTIRALVEAALRKAIDSLAAWTAEGDRAINDHRLLSSALEEAANEPDLFSVFERLAFCEEQAIEGLILVFDQLEEVLRLGRGAAAETVDLLRELVESRLPLRLLLSLRTEYIGELRGLERTVGGLMGRTVFLQPIGRQTMQDVVRAAAATAGYDVDEVVVQEVFSWLSADLDAVGQREAVTAGTPEEAIDLLTLQAILRELFIDFAAHDTASNSAIIDSEALERYKLRYGTDAANIVGKALLRWVASAFSSESSGSTSETPVGLAQRLAVRIAPHLSSAGYKIAQEESDLFRKAVGDDIWALGLRDPTLRGQLRLSAAGRLDTDALGLTTGDEPVAEKHVSGIAYENHWTRDQTAQHLAGGFLAALERLRNRNIVKPSYSWEGRTGSSARRWELVHDGLGRPFARWAEQWKDTWEDCEASLVASRGLSPLGIRPDRVPREPLRFARWEGCQIAPTSGVRVALEGIGFVECTLSGSIFQDIDFRGCRFQHCDLDGVVFLNCAFDAHPDHGPVRFTNCTPNSLAFIACQLGHLEFDGCALTQLTVRDCILEATVVFRSTVVTLSNFVGLRPGHDRAALDFEASSEVSYSSGDPDSWGLLHFGRATSFSGPREAREAGRVA